MKILELIVQNNDRVIDIGGNRGIYAYQLWKRGARVEVFEPNPTCYRVLEAWVIGKPGIHVHSVALSNSTGTATLHIPIDEEGVMHDASASIEHADFAHAKNQLVYLNTLDSYGFQNVRFIKIDVEGHEQKVIEGALETIRTSLPILLIEIEQRHNSQPIGCIFERLIGLGYQGFFLGQGGLTSLEEFDVARDQTIDNFGKQKGRYINNFLFFHQDRLNAGEYKAVF